MEEYKVLITTSGVGSRLGELTLYTNKCLVRVGKKPAISYIIENYPEHIEIVVTIGYYGNQVRDFLTIAYPNRKFTFVEVDNYDGDGSSLGYSLLQAKKYIQCPFIFNASDTIVNELIPNPFENWLGFSTKDNYSQYRTIETNENLKIYDKGHMNSNCVYIGLAGIKDYNKFWNSLEEEYGKNKNNKQLNDCDAINKIINNKTWSLKKFNEWLDVGNTSELECARKKIKDSFSVLDKLDESVFLFDNFVIKFFYDNKTCLNRTIRGKNLYPLTPKVIDSKPNFYKYELYQGDLLSSIVNVPIFKKFLSWSLNNLWIKKKSDKNFAEICEKFYFQKTINRLNEYFKIHNISDGYSIINGYNIPPVFEMLNKIDKNWMCSDTPYGFHGDYILDNILCKDNKDFKLIDWRQDFGGDLENGDIYYDFGKLNHNLIFNHDIVHKGHYQIVDNENDIRCDILRSDILTNCIEVLHKFVNDNGFDLKKVEVLTSIIWLNMSPLHSHKLGKFLFHFGKLNLYKNLYLK
jgi:choline kinase